MSEPHREMGGIFHSVSFMALVTAPPAACARAYQNIIGHLSVKNANLFWGRTLTTAVAYKKYSVQHNRKNATVFTRLAVVRIEFSLRRSGHVLGRVSYRFKKDGREIIHGWRHLGHLDPFTAGTLMELEALWTSLGYMVTRRMTPAKMRAEMVLIMLDTGTRR